MARLSNFTIDALEELSRELRVIGAGASTMQASARRITSYLYDCLRGPAPSSDCVAIALYKTHPCRALPLHLHALAHQMDERVTDSTPCLVRMSVAPGDGGIDALGEMLPLTSASLDAQHLLPSLFSMMGLDLESVPDPITAIQRGLHHRTLDGFFVPDIQADTRLGERARSELEQLGTRSAIGLGAGLPSGSVYMLFVLSRTSIPVRSGRLMQSLTPAVKASLVPYTHRPFDQS
jgi:hypothetical protein